jgi:RND family efflux transporter MFP subunit
MSFPGFKKIATSVAALAAIISLASCSKPPAPQQAALHVDIAHPQPTILTNWDEYPGRLEAVQMVELRPRVSGYLEAIHFKDGEEVKQGDVLFTIDQKPYQAALQQLTATREGAEAHLEWTSNDWQRADNLFKNKAISAEELDSRSTAMTEADAAVRVAVATEDVAKLNLSYTEIKAPVDGRIGQRLITIGNLVQDSAPATLMATIVSVDPVYCYFTADERAYLGYRQNVGPSSSNTIPCELALANETGYPHTGHLDFFDNQVDANSGTIQMRAEFANEDRKLVPGLFARVRVPAGPPVSALLIPDFSVQSDQGHKFVYIVGSNNIVEARPVEVSRQSSGSWQVTSGLMPTDSVITSGLLMVRPGIPVDTSAPAATPAAAAKQ